MKYTSRKLLATLLAFAVVISCGVTAFAGQQATGVVAVKGSDVCMRSSASDSGSEVAVLDNGMIVSILGKSGDWYQVNYNGNTGYVSGSSLDDVADASELNTTGLVTASDVNVRDSASASGKLLGTVNSGTELSVTGFDNGWYAVTFAGKEGYIRSDFMTLNGEGTPVDETPVAVDATVAAAEAAAKTAVAATAAIISASPAPQKATVTGSEVRLRAQANTDCEILANLSRGDSVTVLQKMTDWYKVTFDSKTGYVSADFITLNSADSVSSSAAGTAKVAAAPTAKAPALSATDTKVKAVGLVTGDSVRMRSESNTSSSTVTTLSRGTAVSVLDSLSGWYKINYNGKDGYMSADYLDVKSSATGLSSYGIVKADSLNIRSDISTSASVVTTARNGACVDVTGFEKGWFSVKYNDKSGYVSGDYLTLTNSKPAPAAPKASVPSNSDLPSGGSAGSGSGSGYDIVSTAEQYLGVPYVYGGASPSGFDCSGFTMYVYQQYGYSLPHGATPQLNYGSAVSKSELQPGDLVFFTGTSSTTSAASHVGIYIGDGQFIHASSGTGYCVKISSLNENYYTNHYLTGRHIA